MEFKVNINDPFHLQAITWAREQYNAQTSNQPGSKVIETDEAFVQWEIDQVTNARAGQLLQTQIQQKLQQATSVKDLKRIKDFLTLVDFGD